MKIQLTRNRQTGGSILAPIIPPKVEDLNDLFDIEVFGTRSSSDVRPRLRSATIAPPFADILVRWKINPKVPEAKFEDYTFRIIGPPLLKFENIGASGSVSFLLTKSTDLWLQGAKNGASNTMLGSKITVTADVAGCQPFTVPTTLIESAVINEMNNFLATTNGSITYRTETVPIDASSLNGPYKEIVYEPSSTVDTEGFKFNFPLEIILPNFFDADFELEMELKFSVTHFLDRVELDVDIDFAFDVSFTGAEHVLGQVIASPHAIAKTIEKMLPFIFSCRKPALEQQISQLIFTQTPGFNDALTQGQLQAVIIYPGSRSLEFTVCTPPAVQPGNDPAPGGGVVNQ